MAEAYASRGAVLILEPRWDAIEPEAPDLQPECPVYQRVSVAGGHQVNVLYAQSANSAAGGFQAAWALGSNSIIGVI